MTEPWLGHAIDGRVCLQSTYWDSAATVGECSAASDRAFSWLAKLLAINGLVFLVLISAFTLGGDSPKEAIESTSLKATNQLRHATYDNSWWPMLKTYQHHLENPSDDLYSVFFNGNVKYQYPPSALLPLDLLPRSMTVVGGRTEFDEGLKQALRYLSLGAVFLTALVSVLVLKLGLDRWSPSGSGSSTPYVVGLTALGLANALVWYPLLVGQNWGHIQSFLNLLISLSIAAYLMNRPVASGVFLGICCLVKPHYGLMLVWAALRRQWGFAAGLVGTAAAGTVLGLIRYGIDDYFSYVRVLAWLSQRGEAIWTNQALNGLLHRFLGNGNAVEAVGQTQSAFPPYHMGVHIISTVFMLAILAAGLLSMRGRGRNGGPLDFVTMMVAVAVAVPLAWVYQYGAFLPVFALAMAMVVCTRGLPRYVVPILLISYIGIGHVILKWHWFFENPWRGLLGAHMFFAALGFLILLLYLRSRPLTTFGGRQPALAR